MPEKTKAARGQTGAASKANCEANHTNLRTIVQDGFRQSARAHLALAAILGEASAEADAPAWKLKAGRMALSEMRNACACASAACPREVL